MSGAAVSASMFRSPRTTTPVSAVATSRPSSAFVFDCINDAPAYSTRWFPVFAQGIAHRLVALALAHRPRDGRSEHLGIEVWTHTLNDFAVEERIRLRLATQLMPFLPGRRLARFFLPLGVFLWASRNRMAATNSPPATARDDLGEPQAIAFRMRLVHAFIKRLEPVVLGKNIKAPDGPPRFQRACCSRSRSHCYPASLLFFY